MLLRNRRPTRGFTLVELLVVIGIIAVLIGILLPVMGRVRAQGRTVSCQANIRSIIQSLFIYAADNKGSLPFGFIWNQMRLEPGGARPGTSTGTPAYSFNWASMATKIMQPKASSSGMLSAYGFNKVFKCPESVQTPEFIQPVHYAAHSVAMPNMQDECTSNGGEYPQNDLIRPARLTDLYPDNALIWDMPLILSFTNFEPGADKQLGFAYSNVDGSQLRYPRFPEYRYRNNDDYFAGQWDLSWSYPIWFPAPSLPAPWDSNADDINSSAPNQITAWNFHIGTTRFRHNGGNVCNVGFADGVVRPIAWFPKRYVKDSTPQDGAADNEFLRKYIMIKWPKNRKPSFAS